MSRKIDTIILHCTATAFDRELTAAEVGRWHVRRGFSSIGYHFLIRLDGHVEDGRPIEQEGAHCLGHNSTSIGIAYAGGLDSQGNPCNTLNARQIYALQHVLPWLCKRYPIRHIYGHNQLSNKLCPCFDVPTFIRENVSECAHLV